MPAPRAEQPLIACRGVGKVYTSFRRRGGLAGIWHNFFNRRYEQFTALEAIDLAIAPGEFVGLIGANGAGKTTLVKCLTGIIPTSTGRAELFGEECFALTQRPQAAPRAGHGPALAALVGPARGRLLRAPARDLPGAARALPRAPGASTPSAWRSAIG